MIPQIIVSVVAGAGGVAAVYFGAKILFRMLRLAVAGTTAPAIVVSHRTDVSGLYYPIVEFSDSAGVQRSATSEIGSSGKTYAEGTSVKVRYRSGDPEHAVIKSGEPWYIAIAALGLGVACLFIAIGVWSFIPVRFELGF